MADRMAQSAINTKMTLKPCTGRQIPYTTSSRILPWNTVTASCLLSGVNAKSASEITSYRPLTPTLAFLALLSDTTNDRLLLLWKEDDGFWLLVLLGDTPKLGSESSFSFLGPWGKRSCGSLCKLNVWCCDKTYKSIELQIKSWNVIFIYVKWCWCRIYSQRMKRKWWNISKYKSALIRWLLILSENMRVRGNEWNLNSLRTWACLKIYNVCMLVYLLMLLEYPCMQIFN